MFVLPADNENCIDFGEKMLSEINVYPNISMKSMTMGKFCKTQTIPIILTILTGFEEVI